MRENRTPSPGSVVVDVTLRGIHEGEAFPVPAQLRYDDRHQYQVSLVLRPGQGRDEIEWVFGRDLLLAAHPDGTGCGDVVVAATPGSDWVSVVLGGEAHAVRFEVPAGPLTDFIERSLVLVPEGQEVWKELEGVSVEDFR